jgi:hypothetical protein
MKIFIVILLSFTALFAQSQDPGLKVNIILWSANRCAWFSWMGRQEYKLKLAVEYRESGQDKTVTRQHGLNGDNKTMDFYLKSGTAWENKPPATDGTREGHRFNFFAKGSPTRKGFFKTNLSDIGPAASITKATLWHHIHDSEGLKAGSVAPGQGFCEWSECPRDWNWQTMTWTHYDIGKPWQRAGGDIGRLIARKDREVDLARQGYHKNGNRDYPLDITDYIQTLQAERQAKMSGTALESSLIRKAGTKARPEIKIYDITGKLAAALKVDLNVLNRGLVWQMIDLPSGIYLVQATINNRKIFKKVIYY